MLFLIVPVTLGVMAQRTNAEVADYVNRRRRDLGLTRNDLLDRTRLSPKTLDALLRGTRRSQEDTEARVEPILLWATGSIRDIRNGGEPTALPAPASTGASQAPPATAPGGVFEDAAVAGFPAVFDSLPREIQLQIIGFTEQAQTAARTGQSQGRQLRDAQDDDAETPDPPGNDE